MRPFVYFTNGNGSEKHLLTWRLQFNQDRIFFSLKKERNEINELLCVFLFTRYGLVNPKIYEATSISKSTQFIEID